jgi:hypothetical protein
MKGWRGCQIGRQPLAPRGRAVMWSRIKKAVKAVVRAVVRIAVGVVMRAIHIIGSALDPIYMVKKKMRVQVFVLRDSPPPTQGLVAEHDLDPAINNAKHIFLDRFKVEIKPYGNPIVQTLTDVAPADALDVGCDRETSGGGLITTSLGAFGDEFGTPGEYFAGNLAGWVAVPISLRFPITVFVVRSIRNKIGCSIPIADYVTLSATPSNTGSTRTGVNGQTTLAHELAHTCLLMHRDNDKNNLLYPSEPRGTDVTKWQRWVVRTSRHCTWW